MAEGGERPVGHVAGGNPLRRNLTGHMWRNVSMLNQNTVMPQIIDQLLKQLLRGEKVLISPYDFLGTMAHVIMIECGFIPIVKDNTGITIMLRNPNHVLSLETGERMKQLIGDLLKIAELKGNLHSVSYKYAVEAPAGADDRDSFQADGSLIRYNKEEINFNITPDGGWCLMSMTSTGQDMKMYSFTIKNGDFIPVWGSYEKSIDFLRTGLFSGSIFANCIKKAMIYPFTDSESGIWTLIPTRRLTGLNGDVLIEMCKYLDPRSFLRFTATNKQLHGFRENKEIWSCMVSKIATDFTSYGLPPPTPPNIPAVARGAMDDGLTVMSRYKGAFARALRERAENTARERAAAENVAREIVEVRAQRQGRERHRGPAMWQPSRFQPRNN